MLQLQSDSTNNIPLIIIILTGLLLACFSLFSSPQTLSYFVSDDAYYYLLTAFNISNGNGSTFDGINFTNGFHPQWMLLLLPIYLISSNLEQALHLVFIFQILLNLTSFILIYKWLASRTDMFTAVSGLILLTLFYSPVVLMFNGLESALLIFWLSLLLFLDNRLALLDPNANLNKRLLLGFLLAGMFTARLDSAFVIIALALFKIIWPGHRIKLHLNIIYLIKFYLPTVLIFFLCISPYFLWNLENFGHFTPISGNIKNTFPHLLERNLIGSHAIPFVIPSLLITLYFVATLFLKKGNIYRKVISTDEVFQKHLMILSISVGCIVHLAWTRYFMLFGIYQWHFVMYIIPIVYFSLLIINDIWKNKSDHITKRSFALFLLLAIGSIIYNSTLIYEKGAHHKNRITAAAWARENIPNDKAIALSDAGVFAYYNDITTLNIDGLINSYEFQDAVDNNQLINFFKRQNVDYLADAYAKCDSTDHSLYVFAWRGKYYPSRIGYKFQFKHSDAIFKGDKLVHRPLTKKEHICFTIWQINDAQITRFQ